MRPRNTGLIGTADREHHARPMTTATTAPAGNASVRPSPTPTNNGSSAGCSSSATPENRSPRSPTPSTPQGSSRAGAANGPAKWSERSRAARWHASPPPPAGGLAITRPGAAPTSAAQSPEHATPGFRVRAWRLVLAPAWTRRRPGRTGQRQLIPSVTVRGQDCRQLRFNARSSWYVGAALDQRAPD